MRDERSRPLFEALHAVAGGRKNRILAGSDEGGHHAAVLYTLIQTARLNDIDPQTWLADVLARLPIIRARRSPTCCLELEHRQIIAAAA